MFQPDYCNSLTKYARLNTSRVCIRNLEIGDNLPIVVQSMGNTATTNVDACVEQAIRIFEAGGAMVRFTACTVEEAECLGQVKNKLNEAGYHFPIIADVHFNPEAAYAAAHLVDKVRINPGNFADKRTSATEIDHDESLQNLRQKFIPFLKICKKHFAAIRIGTNHGSLSARIMERCGDTPEGMVEATMEYLRICKEENFKNVVVSMKASNSRIMVYAYRLLVTKMKEEGMAFPLHLGVTEAGVGEDGRIKSAVGIGTLMADGIGDTIRVSLTEDPENEIPVAQKLVDYFKGREDHQPIPEISSYHIHPFEYFKRLSHQTYALGGKNVPIVVADLSREMYIREMKAEDLGFRENADGKWTKTAGSPDYLYMGTHFPLENLPAGVSQIVDNQLWEDQHGVFPLFSFDEYIESKTRHPAMNFIHISLPEWDPAFIRTVKTDPTLVLVLTTSNLNGVAEQRAFFNILMENNIDVPVFIQRSYIERDFEQFQLKSAADCGALFIDGLGDGIWLKNTFRRSNLEIISTSFAILQACRVRMSRTDYIACPSCGRTQFDIQKALAGIREKTGHLKNLKIGVMGCIVNGPGEMADADYGFVGAASGKIHLYKNQTLVKSNILQENAVDELIRLIRENNDWSEPEC